MQEQFYDDRKPNRWIVMSCHKTMPRTVMLIPLAGHLIRTSRRELCSLCLSDTPFASSCNVGEPTFPRQHGILLVNDRRNEQAEKLKNLTRGRRKWKNFKWGACNVLLWQWYRCSAFEPRPWSFFFQLFHEYSEKLFSLSSWFCVCPLDEFYFVIQICHVFIRRILLCGSNILYSLEYFVF